MENAAIAACERIFATKAALTSPDQAGVTRREVVLGQAILGLLIEQSAASRGELRNKADLGRDSLRNPRYQFALTDGGS
ncbi:hypothetical protein MTX20_23205 [Bradyrhizobium sp. ISRA435]|nr:hypothetical protein MTX20_23205 [Bradyrhizobium sp. ISRA435]